MINESFLQSCGNYHFQTNTETNTRPQIQLEIRYEGSDLRPSGGQPLGSSLARRLSSEGSGLKGRGAFGD